MVSIEPADLTIVILAGGRATRFPGKLEAPINGKPLLEVVYRNLRDCGNVVIAGAGSFSPTLDAALDCPIIVDRWPGRGPLAGLLSACSELETAHIFAVAGDAPNVDSRVLDALKQAMHGGDEAIVPEHSETREPLAAIYDREAVLREGFEVLRTGNASMHALLDRLNTRVVPLSPEFFTNVNTVADLV